MIGAAAIAEQQGIFHSKSCCGQPASSNLSRGDAAAAATADTTITSYPTLAVKGANFAAGYLAVHDWSHEAWWLLKPSMVTVAKLQLLSLTSQSLSSASCRQAVSTLTE